jgi:hypothetical protein
MRMASFLAMTTINTIGDNKKAPCFTEQGAGIYLKISYLAETEANLALTGRRR